MDSSAWARRLVFGHKGVLPLPCVCPLTLLPSIHGTAGPGPEQKEWAVAFIFGKLFFGKTQHSLHIQKLWRMQENVSETKNNNKHDCKWGHVGLMPLFLFPHRGINKGRRLLILIFPVCGPVIFSFVLAMFSSLMVSGFGPELKISAAVSLGLF